MPVLLTLDRHGRSNEPTRRRDIDTSTRYETVMARPGPTVSASWPDSVPAIHGGDVLMEMAGPGPIGAKMSAVTPPFASCPASVPAIHVFMPLCRRRRG